MNEDLRRHPDCDLPSGLDCVCTENSSMASISAGTVPASTQNAALVDSRKVVPQVVVVHAVDLPIHLVDARTVDETEPPANNLRIPVVAR